MAIRRDDQGNLYSDYDCSQCDTSGPHYASFPIGDSPFFQCAVCMSPVGDSSPLPPGT
ncbi:hypothetical protein [Arthrobacter sp. 260]|uniref:hypothetical protein n=1 Tax=Arthrobacter sp. 260 TaxID=2735314 RepID=UPI0014925468|nr:hypothetical protein [Arthrobacter sp. 260]NOJ61641.1 hypothetical protein [Arthrobacter sp. 260]